MAFLAELWLPILLSAVFVFIASSVIHMVLPIHKSDYQGLPAEDELMGAMRDKGVSPGHYVFPRAESMKEMGSPEMLAKLNQGPVGFMTVLPNGPMNMGKQLSLWFGYCLLIGIFVAYLGSLALEPGAPYMTVFRITGTVAVLGYAVNNMVDSIWKGIRWGITAKFLFDGAVYGLVTAGTFAWLWPAA